MDTLKTVLDTKAGIAVGGASSIWISFVEWLPFWLRVAILLGTCLTIWLKVSSDFSKCD